MRSVRRQDGGTDVGRVSTQSAAIHGVKVATFSGVGAPDRLGEASVQSAISFDLGDERGEPLLIRRNAEFLGGRRPAEFWEQNLVGQRGKVRMECHVSRGVLALIDFQFWCRACLNPVRNSGSSLRRVHREWLETPAILSAGGPNVVASTIGRG